MNKILRNILSIAVVSASFVSCSQVDMVSEEELVEQKKSTAVTVSLSDWPTTRTVVFATNTAGSCDTVFTYNFNKENKLTDIPMGKYKFYAISINTTGYDYENLNFDALSKGKQYYGDVIIKCKTSEYSTSDEGVQRALSGKYVSSNSGGVYADSTMLVEVKLGQEAHATFQKSYKLTTQYKVSGSITSSRAAQNVYVEICDIIGKKKPNGAAIGGNKVKCVLPIGGAAKDTKKEFEQSLTVLGVSKTGTANIYVRFKGDDTSTTPEMKSVIYTVVDGQEDDGTPRRIIKLGDITF